MLIYAACINGMYNVNMYVTLCCDFQCFLCSRIVLRLVIHTVGWCEYFLSLTAVPKIGFASAHYKVNEGDDVVVTIVSNYPNRGPGFVELYTDDDNATGR